MKGKGDKMSAYCSCRGVGSLTEFQDALSRLLGKFADRVVAVALFGSFARHEDRETSDVDLFVVVRDMPRGMTRRRRLYEAIQSGLKGPRDVTLIDADEDELFKADLDVTPLLLNVAWDSEILYDPEGKLQDLFHKIRRLVKKAGLKRYRSSHGTYGWKQEEDKRLDKLEI